MDSIIGIHTSKRFGDNAVSVELTADDEANIQLLAMPKEVAVELIL